MQFCHPLSEYLYQYLVYVGVFFLQFSIQLVKAVCRSTETLSIPAETKVCVYTLFHKVTQVFEIHCGKMLGHILYAHVPKCGCQVVHL